MKISARNKGFTLVELLVGLAMASIVMAAIFLSYQAQVSGKISEEVTLDMQQAGRAALALMTRDLRMAGCDPKGTANAGFVTADVNRVRFTYDLRSDPDPPDHPLGTKESDGDLDDPGEGVGYGISSTSGNLGRENFDPEIPSHTGGLQPLVRNADWLNFVYLDADGAPIATPVANLDDIRSVEITFVVRGAEPNRGMLRTFEDNTVYKNQQPTGSSAYATWTPTGAAKKFRRMQFTTTVQCRNMGAK